MLGVWREKSNLWYYYNEKVNLVLFMQTSRIMRLLNYIKGAVSSIFVLICIAVHAQLQGKVVSVSDGDTFTLLTKDKQQVKIRVYGIDCPEYHQDFGQVARKFTSDLIFKKQVYIDCKDTDKYGRTLGIVYVLPDSTNLNEALLKAGLAWHYSYFDHNQLWQDMEDEARQKKIGLWSRNDAIAPWEFRRSERNN